MKSSEQLELSQNASAACHCALIYIRAMGCVLKVKIYETLNTLLRYETRKLVEMNPLLECL